MSNKSSHTSSESVRTNLTISLLPGVREAVVEMANTESRSVSRFLELLIMQRAEGHECYQDKLPPFKKN
jgi:hypothetical protein